MGVGKDLAEKLGLIVQRSEVGRSGDVRSGHAGPVVDIQGGAVVGDGGAQNGNGVGGRGGGLQGRSSVGHDQIHLLGDKLIADGAAVGAVAGGVLLDEGDLVAELFGDGVTEALGGGVKCHMLDKLADTDDIGAVLGGSGAVGRGGGGRGASAGSQGEYHGKAQEQDKRFFHFSFLLKKRPRLVTGPYHTKQGSGRKLTVGL